MSHSSGEDKRERRAELVELLHCIVKWYWGINNAIKVGTAKGAVDCISVILIQVLNVANSIYSFFFVRGWE